MPITINGSGTVTGISAGGLPDAIITQPELAANVAGTGPAFSAYNTTNQSVSANTWTKAQLNTEVFDTANCFDNTTNYRFTPTVAGYYQINGSIYLNYTGAAGTRIAVAIYKNGNTYVENQLTNASASLYGAMTSSALIYMNGSTDYIELYGWSNSATAQFYGVYVYTWLNGTLVRAA